MTLQEFINKWRGEYIDFDGYYGAQCMDLMHMYLLEVFKLPGSVLRAPTAAKAFENGDDNFEKIVYTGNEVPQPGDVMFWSDDYVKGTGHVAIYVEGDEKQFVSFDQNWPVGSNSHKQSHSYDGVSGWLRHESLINKECDHMDCVKKDPRIVQRVEDGAMYMVNDEKKTKFGFAETSEHKKAGVLALALLSGRQMTKEQLKEYREVTRLADAS